MKCADTRFQAAKDRYDGPGWLKQKGNLVPANSMPPFIRCLHVMDFYMILWTQLVWFFADIFAIVFLVLMLALPWRAVFAALAIARGISGGESFGSIFCITKFLVFFFCFCFCGSPVFFRFFSLFFFSLFSVSKFLRILSAFFWGGASLDSQLIFPKKKY